MEPSFLDVVEIKNKKYIIGNDTFTLIFLNLTDKYIPSICEYLNQNQKITNLSFNSNNFTFEGISLLVSTLRNLQNIKSIGLSGNDIGDKGFAILYEYVLYSKLEILYLAICGITNNSIDKIKSLLKYSQLTSINLSGNYFNIENLIDLLYTCPKIKQFVVKWEYREKVEKIIEDNQKKLISYDAFQTMNIAEKLNIVLPRHINALVASYVFRK